MRSSYDPEVYDVRPCWLVICVLGRAPVQKDASFLRVTPVAQNDAYVHGVTPVVNVGRLLFTKEALCFPSFG